jgi:hypothetical protein
MSNSTKWVWGLIAALPFAAQAQVDLTQLDRDMVGPRTQVLVLGTVHLSTLKNFKPASLGGVLDRLAVYKPDIITIEQMPGDECDLAARQPAKYGADYCGSADVAKAATGVHLPAAQAATGLDIPAALTEVDKTLKAWPAQPTAAQRRHLAAVFLAAEDPSSAYVQWLQLPEAERHAGDNLDAALVARLGRIGARANETIQIAATLAARLRLQRVYPVDNHTGDNLDVPDAKAYGREIEAVWAAGSAKLNEIQKREDVLAAAPDLLPLYRSVNDPANLRLLAEVNVSVSLRSKSSAGQLFVGGWEVRNLRMVANVRETFRERPGARVLSIVGSSHKPWFDAWLGQLQGVDIVDVEAILK